MIVDDHVDIRKVLKSILTKSLTPMPKVFEYDSGEEAVAAYEVQRPDYVLMDIELQIMDGFEAAKKIYALDPLAKIIMVTSYDTSAFRAKAERMKVKGYISKDSLSEITPLLNSLAQSAS